MDLVTTSLIVAGYSAVPAAVGSWLLARFRSRRRNAAAKCGSCGKEWSEIESPERFFVHGRLVCEDCATRAKGRLGWQFGLLGVASVLSSVAVLLGEDPAILALVPPAVVGTFAVGTISVMKLANRRAQAQIAMGSYPFLPPASDRRPAKPDDEWGAAF
jgi:hypothetical protein